MGDAGNWCLIESDPGVFTELISDIGVKGTQVEEIYALDDYVLKDLKPSYGIIFLFKWQGSESSEPHPESVGTNDNIFFAKQVINNACATQAILSILLNAENINLGDELMNFKQFTKEFPPDYKGLAISNMNLIRTVHNSFARSDPFISDGLNPRDEEKEDAFHFVSYVPIHGALWELDGLASGPVNLGPCTEDNWLEKVRPVIEMRMARYATSEIRFNLMAVIRDREEVYTERKIEIENILLSLHDNQDFEKASLLEEKSLLEQKIETEREKRRRYKRENAMRKHNFIPMIYNLLCVLAEKGHLEPLVAEGRSKQRRDAEKELERKKANKSNAPMDM